MPDVLTIGQVAKQVGATTNQVRRLFQSGKLPEPERLGPFRIFTSADVPNIRMALQATQQGGRR